jgi:Domain of unknown function (DUF4306)
MLLLFSAGASWYEGSKIVEDPWEWKYTAVFSHYLHGSVENANDILPIDHFVYAVKFVPTYPLLMLLSGTYLILLIGYILVKRNHKLFACLLSFIGVLFLVLSQVISSSPTIGWGIFHNTLMPIGIFLLVAALILYFQRINGNKIEE